MLIIIILAVVKEIVATFHSPKITKAFRIQLGDKLTPCNSFIAPIESGRKTFIAIRNLY